MRQHNRHKRQRVHVPFLAMALAALAGTSTALAVSTGNLLTNPGAESGTNSWTVTRGELARYYGGAHGGSYYFYGGQAEYSNAQQTVYLPSHMSINAIDNGEAHVDVSWWNRSYVDGSTLEFWDVGTHDTSEVYIRFFDANNHVISLPYDSGEQKSAYWNPFSKSNIALPAGTRYITYYMYFNRFRGDDNDGYVDDNYLNIDYTKNVYWKSTAGGTWADASRWTAAVPGSGDDVVFNKSATYAVTLNAPLATNNLSVLAGNVTMTGNGISYPSHTNNGNLSVGVSSAATLKIAGNAHLYFYGSGAHDIGKNAGVSGGVTVDGAGSSLSIENGWLGIGNAGGGTLTITNAGAVYAASGYVGYGNGGAGTLDVGGNSTKYLGASLTLGGNSSKTTLGRGIVNLHDNASMQLSSTLNIYNTTGTIVNFSGGMLSAAYINLDGNAAHFNWTAGTLTLGGGHVMNLGGASLTIPQGGSLKGTGTIDGSLHNDGTLAPGNSPGLLTIAGNLVQLNDGVLLMELGGLTRGSGYDALDITGTLYADGALHVSAIGGFVPHLGDSFHLFNFASFTGNFDAITLPQIASGLNWDISGMTSAGTITVVPEPSETSLFIALTTLMLWTRCRPRRT